MPKPTDEAQDLTKDFSDSPLHRFRVKNESIIKISDNLISLRSVKIVKFVNTPHELLMRYFPRSRIKKSGKTFTDQVLVFIYPIYRKFFKIV